MPSFNKVILAGNLTRDVEIRYTPKRTAIGQFGLAVNRQWTTDSGEKKEAVTFVDCKVWGKLAETLAQYTHKGSPLLLEGRLDLEQWDDKQTGDKRQKLVVVIETFQFLGGKKEGDAPPSKAKGKAKTKPTAAPAGGEDPGDDVPF